jgi:hypothetical protein
LLGLVFFFLIFGAPPLVALFRYFSLAQSYRPLWRTRTRVGVLKGEVGYRDTAVPPLEHFTNIPWDVRLAALTSLLMGSAIVPGGLMAVVGVFALGIGLLGIPGLVVAASLLGSAGPLLSGHSESAVVAARAARASLRLNGILLPLSVLVGSFAFFGVSSYDRNGYVSLSAFTGFYAALSIAQAWLTVRAVATVLSVDAHSAAKRELLSLFESPVYRVFRLPLPKPEEPTLEPALPYLEPPLRVAPFEDAQYTQSPYHLEPVRVAAEVGLSASNPSRNEQVEEGAELPVDRPISGRTVG